MRCPSGLSGASYGGRAEPSERNPSEMRTALFRARSLEGALSLSLSFLPFLDLLSTDPSHVQRSLPSAKDSSRRYV